MYLRNNPVDSKIDRNTDREMWVVRVKSSLPAGSFHRETRPYASCPAAGTVVSASALSIGFHARAEVLPI
jgi:hypothetical protein